MRVYQCIVYLLSVPVYILFPIQIEGPLPTKIKGRCIVTSNHFHWMDPVLLAVLFRKSVVHFMAKTELFTNPFLGYLLRKAGIIEVDREKSGIGAVKQALKRLKDDEVLGIFAQGKRVRPGEQDALKSGLGMLSIKTQTPVLPVTIEGPYRLFHKVKVTIHPLMIPPEADRQMGAKQYADFTDQVMGIVLQGER